MAQGAGRRPLCGSPAAGGGGGGGGGRERREGAREGGSEGRRMLRRRPGRGAPCCYLAGGGAAAALCIVGAAGGRQARCLPPAGPRPRSPSPDRCPSPGGGAGAVPRAEDRGAGLRKPRGGCPRPAASRGSARSSPASARPHSGLPLCARTGVPAALPVLLLGVGFF